MPWPGTPKSQQTPPINPPSVRFPATLNENSSMADVADAMRTAFNGLTVHEQAFANLPEQVAAQAKAAATQVLETISAQTVAGVTSFNTQTGAVIYFPGLGTVNNQLGQASYETQQSDAGAKILVGDSGPVTVTLGPVNAPWFAFIGNDSSATVILMPDSGALYGLQSIYPGGFAIIFFDGTNWWSEGVAIATDSSLGVVEPDGVTIGIDSGMIYTQVSAGTGAPSSHPATPGNPFYFDSGASPWHGYVWFQNAWNRFS
jgi:hypothetical protein